MVLKHKLVVAIYLVKRIFLFLKIYNFQIIQFPCLLHLNALYLVKLSYTQYLGRHLWDKTSHPCIYWDCKSYKGQSYVDASSSSVDIFKVYKFIALNLNHGLLLDDYWNTRTIPKETLKVQLLCVLAISYFLTWLVVIQVFTYLIIHWTVQYFV